MKKGSHSILTAPAFEKSQTGLLQDKLSKTFYREGKLDNYTHRYTTKDDIVPDKPKSRAKKVTVSNTVYTEHLGIKTLCCLLHFNARHVFYQ